MKEDQPVTMSHELALELLDLSVQAMIGLRLGKPGPAKELAVRVSNMARRVLNEEVN